MVRSWLALGALLVAACGDQPLDPTPHRDAYPPSTGPLDVDVVVTWGGDPIHAWLSIYPREQPRPCLCNAEWPPLDQCVTVYEQGQCTCWPLPAICLDSVRAERDGVVIGAGEAFIPGYISFDVPDLETAESITELVLVGCGGRARVPLPPEPMLAPTVDTISYTDDEVLLTWTSPSEHDEVSIWCTSEGNATGCVLPAASPARVVRDEQCDGVSFAVVDGGEPVETDVGTVRVWRQHAINSFNAVYFPESIDGGRLGLPTNAFNPQFSNIRADVALVVDGAGDSQQAVVIAASIDPADPDTSLAFEALATYRFVFTAGPATDHLRVNVDGTWYAGELAHTAPADRIEIGWYRDELYAVSVGPLVLTSETDANDTVDVSLAIDWNLGIVAKPALASIPVSATSSD